MVAIVAFAPEIAFGVKLKPTPTLDSAGGIAFEKAGPYWLDQGRMNGCRSLSYVQWTTVVTNPSRNLVIANCSE